MVELFRLVSVHVVGFMDACLAGGGDTADVCSSVSCTGTLGAYNRLFMKNSSVYSKN